MTCTSNTKIRVDPRLKVDCCPSLASGVERLKSLQAEINEFARKWESRYAAAIDLYWIDQVVFAAEDEHADFLSQAESKASQRSLIDQYSKASANKDQDTTVTLIMGDATYLIPFMNSLNCISHSRVPSVGQIWQIYSAYLKPLEWHWVRKPWTNYTLSKEAWKQAQEPPRVAYADGASIINRTDDTRGSMRLMSDPKSPLSSVAPKQRRGSNDSDR